MMLESLLFGITVGLAAGLSPGPLITLVVSETLKNGKKEGIKVAISPLISEAPIILLVLAILSNFAGNYTIIGAISLLGACFVIYLGLSNLTTETKQPKEGIGKGNALLKGITTNLLNPSTYMFWLTVGGPRIIDSVHVHTSATILFILGFYMMLVGSETAVAMAVDKSRNFVKSEYYVRIIRVLGIVLIVFGLIFIRDFLEFIGAI